MTNEERFDKVMLAAVDRSIAEAKELEGKTLTRDDVLRGWKKHLELANKS